MSKSKIIDLEISSDGAYSSKSNNTKDLSKAISHKKEEKFNKYHVRTEADEFLGGLDVGLDFVEAVKIRALRIMGMRD